MELAMPAKRKLTTTVSTKGQVDITQGDPRTAALARRTEP